MTRILVISYSQSGEVARVVGSFANALQSSTTELTFATIRPQVEHPYPWRSIRRFFDVMPECLLGRAPRIDVPEIAPGARFDLVVLAYPVWFLSPALPVQGFLKSAFAEVLRNTDVITISVSRAMWQQAAETMKRLLAANGAMHCDNIAATHAGSAIATLISTPRALLLGKRDRFLGVFREAGVSKEDLDRLGLLGSVVAQKIGSPRSSSTPFLSDEPVAMVKRWLIVPEILAWHVFYAWAVVISRLAMLGRGLRAVGVYAFAMFLVVLIVIGLPLSLIGTWIASPVLKHRIDAYIRRLSTTSVVGAADE